MIGHCICCFWSPVGRFTTGGSWLVVQWMNKRLRRSNEWMRGPPVPNLVKVTPLHVLYNHQPPSGGRSATFVNLQLFCSTCQRERIEKPVPDKRMKSAGKWAARNGTPSKTIYTLKRRRNKKSDFVRLASCIFVPVPNCLLGGEEIQQRFGFG